jgi:hypothetical protein
VELADAIDEDVLAELQAKVRTPEAMVDAVAIY